MNIVYSASILTLVVLSGCAHTKKFGDATYREPYGPQLGIVTSALSFQTVSLASKGETKIRVRGLTSSAYPRGVRIPIPASENLEGRVDQPWRSCRFSVAITNATNNTVIYKQQFNLKDYVTSGSALYQSSSDKYINLRLAEYGEDGRHSSYSWTPTLDYNIIMKVHSPSNRKGDTLHIESVFTRQTFSEQGLSTQPSVAKAPSGG